MSSDEIQVGDTVRVNNPDEYIVEFAKKVRDRDAVVQSVFPPLGRFNSNPMARVEFQKRNGRGKVFTEVMRASSLVVVKKAGAA